MCNVLKQQNQLYLLTFIMHSLSSVIIWPWKEKKIDQCEEQYYELYTGLHSCPGYSTKYILVTCLAT